MTHTRLRQIWDRLQTSYWFAPLVMGLLALVLAQIVLRLDAVIPDAALSLAPFVYTGSAAEARGALLALAGTILATAGVVYSLLTLPLSVAAAQFGSRLLRLYLRDRTIQVVLGLFVATFVTCLTVALSIPSATLNPDTPQLATSTAIYLSLATLASLVLMIHHIATALQAPNLVAVASAELQGVIRAPMVPAGVVRRRRARPGSADGADGAAESRDEALAALAAGAGQRVDAAGLGYVQAIDPEAILALAIAHDLVIRVVHKPGHFVRPGDLLALAWPPQRAAGAAVVGILGCYDLGNLRTPTQDVRYAINQLVEVALRAMSPAINDPFTAMTCLDHLGAGLALYAELGETSPYLRDTSGRPRLVFDRPTFGELLDAAFGMLRRASRDNAYVLLRMVDTVETIARGAAAPEQRAELARHVRLVEAESLAGSGIAWDKQRLGRRCADVLASLDNFAPRPDST